MTSRAPAKKAHTHEAVGAAILKQALARAAEEGWTDALLAHAAKAARHSPAQARIAFPKGAADLVAYYSETLDRAMIERLASVDPSQLKIRERVKAAIRARIEAVEPHKDAARRAGALLALPHLAPLALALSYRTADRIWRWAGDGSTDFNFYTKRALCAGVYLATLVHWFRDTSPRHAETWRFLDRRIDDVMTIERAKADLGKVIQAAPSPWRILAALRYPERGAERR
jgi:ubiquinone biosynthesis protein COQ9